MELGRAGGIPSPGLGHPRVAFGGTDRGWRSGKPHTVNAACYPLQWRAASFPTGEEMEARISLLRLIVSCPERAAPRPGTAARHPGAAALPEATAAL